MRTPGPSGLLAAFTGAWPHVIATHVIVTSDSTWCLPKATAESGGASPGPQGQMQGPVRARPGGGGSPSRVLAAAAKVLLGGQTPGPALSLGQGGPFPGLHRLQEGLLGDMVHWGSRGLSVPSCSAKGELGHLGGVAAVPDRPAVFRHFRANASSAPPPAPRSLPPHTSEVPAKATRRAAGPWASASHRPSEAASTHEPGCDVDRPLRLSESVPKRLFSLNSGSFQITA